MPPLSVLATNRAICGPRSSPWCCSRQREYCNAPTRLRSGVANGTSAYCWCAARSHAQLGLVGLHIGANKGTMHRCWSPRRTARSTGGRRSAGIEPCEAHVGQLEERCADGGIASIGIKAVLQKGQACCRRPGLPTLMPQRLCDMPPPIIFVRPVFAAPSLLVWRTATSTMPHSSTLLVLAAWAMAAPVPHRPETAMASFSCNQTHGFSRPSQKSIRRFHSRSPIQEPTLWHPCHWRSLGWCYAGDWLNCGRKNRHPKAAVLVFMQSWLQGQPASRRRGMHPFAGLVAYRCQDQRRR